MHAVGYKENTKVEARAAGLIIYAIANKLVDIADIQQ